MPSGGMGGILPGIEASGALPSERERERENEREREREREREIKKNQSLEPSTKTATPTVLLRICAGGAHNEGGGIILGTCHFQGHRVFEHPSLGRAVHRGFRYDVDWVKVTKCGVIAAPCHRLKAKF